MYVLWRNVVSVIGLAKVGYFFGVNRRVAGKNVKLNLDLSSFRLCSVTCLKFERGNLYLWGLFAERLVLF